MTRKYGKTDANQHEIVDALIQCGCRVISLASVGGGCGDILVMCPGRILVLMEIKDGSKPPSRQKLTPAQVRFHSEWQDAVTVVRSVDEAIERMKLATRRGR